MKNWTKAFFRLAAIVGLMAAIAAPARAYEVEPMRMTLDLANGLTSAVINVRNTRDQALPIEIVMKRRIVHPDGRQEFVQADEDFSIFPPLALIEPGQSQGVRISYIGDPALADSEAYIAEVQEVPVTDENFTGVIFAYNFGVAVYVEAPQAQADVAVGAVERTEQGVRFQAINSGSGYAMLGDLDVRLSIGGEMVRLPAEQIIDLVENPIIPPHAVRDFLLPLENLPQGPLAVSFGRRS
jgi:P pilus assembly chaperone PapD